MSWQRKGIFLVMGSALLFGVTPVFGRLSYAGGSNAYMLTFLRSFLAIPILGFMAFRQKRHLHLPEKQLKQMGLLCLLGSSLTTASLYGSYTYIPVGVATALHFSYPAIVVVASAAIKKSRLSVYQRLIIALSLAGVALFLDFGNSMKPIGIVMALISAVSFAFYIIYQTASGLSGLDSTVFCLYQAAMVSGIMLVFNLTLGTFTLQLTPIAYFYTALVAILISVVAVACLQQGINLVGTTTAAIFSLLEPITSIAVSVFVLGEKLKVRTFLGCALIMASVLLQALSLSKVNQRE